MYLGVDIGGTAVKMGLVTAQGEILVTHSADVAFDDYETPIIQTVMSQMDYFLAAQQLAAQSLKGIGVSATGQIDAITGEVIGVGGNIKNWLNTPIKQELEARYHVPVTVLNDANCMVLGEAWCGSAKGANHVIGITIGTGVGGGIIVAGQILTGQLGIAGEIGHFSIKSDGKRCTCQNVGCFEQYASMTALVKSVRAAYEDLGLDIPKEEINGAIIFEQVKKGHQKLTHLVNEWIEVMGQGLVSLIHLFNPEVVLIGGGVSAQEELFIEPLRAYVLEHVMTKFKMNLKIESACLGNQAGLVGAIAYHLSI